MDDDVRVLVARATRYDVDAWEQLYLRLYPRLFAFARKRLPADHFADDAVSDTMVRALGGIVSFTWQGAGFDAWVVGILRNVVSEHRRRLGRETPVAVPADTESADFSAADPLAALEEAEQRQVVRRALRRLSADDQELLELRVVVGLSAEHVAAVLGRRAGAVRMAQSRALKRLAKTMREVSDDR